MPPVRARLGVAVLFVPVLVALGCDGEEMDDSADDGVVDRDCTMETRADEYALGLRKSGSAFMVEFVDALPAPPDRGDNTWTVRVTDESGAAMTDIALSATPYMPDHMHGTSIVVHVDPAEVPGEYVLDPVNLFMPGLWEVTLAMTADDGTTDDVVFRFCVDP